MSIDFWVPPSSLNLPFISCLNLSSLFPGPYQRRVLGLIYNSSELVQILFLAEILTHRNDQLFPLVLIFAKSQKFHMATLIMFLLSGWSLLGNWLSTDCHTTHVDCVATCSCLTSHSLLQLPTIQAWHATKHIQQIITHCLMIITALCAVMMASANLKHYYMSILSGEMWVQELLDGHPNHIYCKLGVWKEVFHELICTTLVLQILNMLHWRNNWPFFYTCLWLGLQFSTLVNVSNVLIA